MYTHLTPKIKKDLKEAALLNFKGHFSCTFKFLA